MEKYANLNPSEPASNPIASRFKPLYKIVKFNSVFPVSKLLAECNVSEFRWLSDQLSAGLCSRFEAVCAQ